jgi:hypothetical protein
MGVVGEDHRQRMGESIWLFMWIVGHQTGQLKNGIGIVNYAKPLTYAVICADTGYPRGTVKDWMFTLVFEKYIKRDFKLNNEFVLWVLNAKKYPIAKQFSTVNPHGVRRNPIRPSDGISSEGQTESHPTNVHNVKKTYGFIGSLNKESPKVSPTVLRASPGILIGVEKMDKKEQEETVVPSLDAVARSMSIPRAEKSARELDAERRKQRRALDAQPKNPKFKVVQSTLTLEEQKAELRRRGLLP